MEQNSNLSTLNESQQLKKISIIKQKHQQSLLNLEKQLSIKTAEIIGFQDTLQTLTIQNQTLQENHLSYSHNILSLKQQIISQDQQILQLKDDNCIQQSALSKFQQDLKYQKKQMARNITQETQTQNYHNLQNSQPNISYDEKFNHQKQQISQLQSQLQSIQDNQLNINCLQNNITLPNQLSLHQLQELTIALENDITLITLLRYVLFSAKSQSNSYLSKLANKMKDNMNTITDNTLSQQTRLQASLIFISLIYKFYCQDFPAEDEQKFVVDFDINFTVTREECFGAKARQQILESYKRIRKINLELTDKLEIYIQTFGDISGAAKLVSIGKQTAENRTLEKSQKGNK